MAKRKISVDKLSDKQFAQAQENISKKVSTSANELLNKWRPDFKNLGYHLDLEIEISEQKEVVIAKSESNLLPSVNEPNLKAVAKKLDKMSEEMSADLENAVTSCNSLLNRYGMSCNMAFTGHVISD